MATGPLETRSAANHPTVGVRRPIASTNTSTASFEPSTLTPVTCPPSTLTPCTRTPSRTSMRADSDTARRSAHSSTGLRTPRNWRSSSSGAIGPGNFALGSIACAPAAITASCTSERCLRSSSRPRGMKACGWRKCGMPLRRQCAASSAGPLSNRSRSSRVTEWPSRASISAAERPATPAPITVTELVDTSCSNRRSSQ